MLTSKDDDGAVDTVPGNVKRLYDRWSTLDKGKTDFRRKRIAIALGNDAWMQANWPLVQKDVEWLRGVADGKSSRQSEKK